MMALGLYIEAVKRHEAKDPGYLVALDEKLGGALRKCPECGSPMLTFATRWRLGVVECICSVHGLVLVDLEVK